MQKVDSQKGQTSMIIIGVVVLVIILAGVAYFMTQKGANNVTTETPAESSPQVTDTPAVNDSNTQETTVVGKEVTFEVKGSAFKFAPAALSVNEGDTVTIKFMNTGGFHDFVIDEFNAKTKQIAANQTDEVTFVANKKGTFKYYCSVGNHRAQGMEGTLIVN